MVSRTTEQVSSAFYPRVWYPKLPKITSLFGYPTRKYPWNLETNPTQPIPVDFFGLGRVIPMGTRLKFLPLGTMGTRLKFLPSGTRGPRKLATIVFILNPKLYYRRSIIIVIVKVRSCLEDDTIDALVYLKKYYIRQKDEDISALFKKTNHKNIHWMYNFYCRAYFAILFFQVEM